MPAQKSLETYWMYHVYVCVFFYKHMECSTTLEALVA